MKLPVRYTVLAVLLPIFVSACGSSTTSEGVNDPLEPINRVTHAVNKGADQVFFRPTSQVYGTIVPRPARNSLSNAAANLNGPRSVVNDLLQGNIEDAGHNTARFLVNTTIGVFGLFDPASS